MKPRVRIALQGGRADERRAPVKDVAQLLAEVQNLVLAFGRELFGTEASPEMIEKSCRLELVGLTLASVAPELELAFDADDQPNQIGRRAVEAMCHVFSTLRDPALTTAGGPGPDVIDHIETMSGVLERGYVRIEASYVHDGRRVTGVLDHELRSRLLAQAAGAVAVEGVTVRGVLYGLEDKPTEARETKTFRGRLLDEAGEQWTVRFRHDQVDLARDLWRNTVELTGAARYARTRRPVLQIASGRVTGVADWQEVLRRYRGVWKDLYRGTSFEQIVTDLR